MFDLDQADPYIAAEQPPVMFCRFCQRDVLTRYEDVGIGAFEYWGAKGVDKHLVLTCEVCGYEQLEAAHEETEE